VTVLRYADRTAGCSCSVWSNTIKAFFRSDGASLVETAVSLSVYLMLLIAVIEVLLELYSYHFVSDAAREATRFAVIRGANSCYPNPAFPNCNLGPASITSTTNPNRNPVLQFIDSFRYPGLSPKSLSADVTWWISRQNANGNTSWTTQCSGPVDAKGNACNAEGNAVRVVVTYNFPLTLPWIRAPLARVSSTSQMVINF
jgi:TadE-like protein